MASYSKRGKSWRVQISHQGQRLTATFPTKGECTQWATQNEQDFRNRKLGRCADKTVGHVLCEYESKVSVKKRGYLWEKKRIAVLKGYKIASVRLSDLSARDVVSWRDDRLRDVSGSSVCRDWNLLSHAIETAKREWGWLHENPFKGYVSRPASNPQRDKVFTDDEIDRICISLGDTGLSGKVKDAFLFALETAMRAGEIVNLTNQHIHAGYVHLVSTKNGSPRNVPLSSKASSILDKYRNNETVFGLTGSQRDSLFRKGKRLAGVTGKTFHDTRHTAITRLAKKLNVLELARMVGHKNINQLLTYYNPSASDISEKLI